MQHDNVHFTLIGCILCKKPKYITLQTGSVCMFSFFITLTQESLKKFREETQKLEESPALKKAREKFVSAYKI